MTSIPIIIKNIGGAVTEPFKKIEKRPKSTITMMPITIKATPVI